MMWFMTVPKHKFASIKSGEIMRIRSVEVCLTTNRNVIQVKPSTNILRFYPNSRVVEELTAMIEEETNQDKLMVDDYSEVIMSPEIVTEITNPDYKKFQQFKLNDLFCSFSSLPQEVKEKNLFKVRFYIVRVDPVDPREMV
jgi:hypothetical protein